MKSWKTRFLYLTLAALMVLSLAACGNSAASSSQAASTPASSSEAASSSAAASSSEAASSSAAAAPAPVAASTVGEYTPMGLQFKNKTGVTIDGLYLYPSGDSEKGDSLCESGWPDQDADDEKYRLAAYIVRTPVDQYDVYVEFADGTNATWAGVAAADGMKLSLKNGIDPAKWEIEPVDDEDDLAELADLVTAGKTSDNYYPGYEILGLEIKNKTEKSITEFYFYEEGGDPKQYNNMIPHLVDADGNPITKWESGKGGLYVFNFFIRPHTDFYEILVVYDDGESMTVPKIDLFTPNGDGFASNEISMKDAEDPDLTIVSYDDGDPEPLQDIADAIEAGLPADLWYPKY